MDPLPPILRVQANWVALAVFGHEGLTGMSGHTFNGVPLSWRSFALLFASIDFLQTMFNPNE